MIGKNNHDIPAVEPRTRSEFNKQNEQWRKYLVAWEFRSASGEKGRRPLLLDPPVCDDVTADGNRGAVTGKRLSNMWRRPGGRCQLSLKYRH
jgi:hypothetical protein